MVNPVIALEKALRFLVSIPHQVLVGAGMAVLIGTLVLAALLKDKDLAVAVAVSGTFLGTALLSLYLPRVITNLRAQELRRDLSMSENRGRWIRSEEQREQAERRAVKAEREVTRLESMRINVEAFKPILKLGLLEVETNITDFQHRVIGQEERRGWWRNGYRHAYTGVVQIPVKAHLGVDLQRVQVVEAGDRLIVSGLMMTAVTDTIEGAKWLLDEVRTEYLKQGRLLRFRGDAHDQRAKACSREHELQVRARLKEGQDFKVFESGLIRTAQQVLRVLLAPLGKEISFESVPPNAEARDLLGYLAEHNQELASRIAGLKGELLDAPREHVG